MQLLFAGSVVFSGQDIAYKITETDNKNINIEISILRGSNTNNQNNEKKVDFEFEKKENKNKWILNKKTTKSDIDIFLECEEEEKKRKWLLGTNNLENVGNIQLAFKDNNLHIEKEDKKIFSLTDSGSAKILGTDTPKSKTKETIIEVNIDKMKEVIIQSNKLTGKHIAKVVDGLCNDFQRTIGEKIQRQTGKENSVPREESRVLSR